MKNYILILIFNCFNFIAFNQLYTQSVSALQLDSLVQEQFSSSNVEIFNVSFLCYFWTGVDSSANLKNIGFFNSINSTVGIDSGLVLTGGFIDPPYGLGKPSIYTASYNKVYSPDSLLNTIVFPSQTVGRAVLEFDFVPNGDSIQFNYVFASEEYPNQICSPDNDIFAFHISGPGIKGLQNIALIPNTNIPVGNNSINDTSFHYYSPNIDTSLCQSINYPQYYVDHGGDSTFVFNGSTTVLTARIGTIPCETYHLRFAIAEGLVGSENSAVFLEANSFNSEPLSIELSVSYGGEHCFI